MLDRVATAASRDNPPQSTVTNEARQVRISLSGRWTLSFLDDVSNAVKAAMQAVGPAKPAQIDLSQVSRLDTAGAFAILELQDNLGGKEKAPFVAAKDAHSILLAEIGLAAEQAKKAEPPTASGFSGLFRLFSAAAAVVRDFWRLTTFLGMIAAALGRVIVKPSRFRGTAFVHQLQQTGLNAVPIVGLVCFLIGGVVMQQGAQQLRAFGAEAMAVDMLGILTLREVGVILASVMVAGRSASAFTAQIGTMKMREEIDAMRTIGIDPVETLILPRVLALIVALPLLVFIANVMALAGGALMAKLYLNLDTPIYLQRLNGAIEARHFYVGLIKAPFAALIIALVGCMEGMSVEGSAESVGSQVTTAVVKAIFLVLVLDGIFAIFLSASGF